MIIITKQGSPHSGTAVRHERHRGAVWAIGGVGQERGRAGGRADRRGGWRDTLERCGGGAGAGAIWERRGGWRDMGGNVGVARGLVRHGSGAGAGVACGSSSVEPPPAPMMTGVRWRAGGDMRHRGAVWAVAAWAASRCGVGGWGSGARDAPMMAGVR